MSVRHRDRLPLPLVVLMLVVHILIGCSESAPVEELASTSSGLVTCSLGETLYSATCPSSGPCLVRNTEVRSVTPTVNYSTQTAMNIGMVGSPASDRGGLLGFDLTGIPSSATVTKGVLTLVTGPSAANLTAGSTSVAQNLGAWTEASVTYTSAPLVSSVLGSQTNTLTVNAPWVITLPTSLVQGWVGPGATNDGIRIEGSGGTAKENFITSKNTTVASRPRLDVCYTPAPPPGPCTNGVLDTGETDVDCGGNVCAPCADGKSCVTAADCTNEVCDRSATCVPFPSGSLVSSVSVTAVSYQYGPNAAEWLSVYTPSGMAPAGGWPAVVAWHGGGATSDGGGRNSAALVYWASVLNAEGIAFITADYPLVSGSVPSVVNAFPKQLESTRRAACYIQANAATWVVDESRLGWVGFSYGGNLVSLLVKTKNGTSSGATALTALPMGCALSNIVAREILYYPNTDMGLHSPAQWSAYANAYLLLNVTGSSDPAFAQRSADATAVPASGDPDLYTVDGDADTTVSPLMVRGFAAAARQAGVSVFDLATHLGVHGSTPTTGGIYLPASKQTNNEVLAL